MADLIPTILSDGESDNEFIPAPEVPVEEEENIRMSFKQEEVDEMYSTDSEADLAGEQGADSDDNDWDYRKGATFKEDAYADIATSLQEKIDDRRQLRAEEAAKWASFGSADGDEEGGKKKKKRKLDSGKAAADEEK